MGKINTIDSDLYTKIRKKNNDLGKTKKLEVNRGPN